MKIVFLAALPIMFAFPAAAAEFPKFDYSQTCRDTPPVAMDKKATVEQCMADEKSARESLPKIWARASAGAQRQCAAMTQLGGESSYVELITCLEMEDQKTLSADPTVTGGATNFHNPHPQPNLKPPGG